MAAGEGRGHRPIPGTKRVSRLEENAADDLVLTAELNSLTPPAGGHHNEAQMRLIQR